MNETKAPRTRPSDVGIFFEAVDENTVSVERLNKKTGEFTPIGEIITDGEIWIAYRDGKFIGDTDSFILAQYLYV